MLPAVVIVVALLVGSALADDLLGVYIAAAVAVVTAVNIALTTSGEPLRMKASRPSSRPSWEEPLLTVLNWIFVAVGVVLGTVLAWLGAGNVFAAIAGAVIGAVLGLVAGAVVSGVVSLVLGSVFKGPADPLADDPRR